MKFLNPLASLKSKIRPGLAGALDRAFINIFIIAYFAITVSSLWVATPAQMTLVDRIIGSLTNMSLFVANLAGLGQNWSLFSPNVRNCNVYNLVVVTYQSGMLKLYELPRMEKLNLLGKWQQEKLRKLFNDNFPYPKHVMLRPPASRFLIRANGKPGDPPVRLAYFLISNPIPPPEGTATRADKKANLSTQIGNYFVYGACPEDL